ncbi:MAG TPA: SH3 domain-containing protein [Thermomicrobiales bacterium]
MNYQAEERYWTDYVRVATPIVGLLLLLGVFWYWASSLIGDESGAPPPTTAASVTVIAADTPTPTATEEATLPTETAEAPAATATKAAVEPSRTARPAEPTETATEEVAEPSPTCETGNWCEGDVVLSADNDVRMRSQPSTDADVLEILSLDQPLTVVSSEPQEGDGIVWWNVRDEDSGNEGWVAEEWLKSSG